MCSGARTCVCDKSSAVGFNKESECLKDCRCSFVSVLFCRQNSLLQLVLGGFLFDGKDGGFFDCLRPCLRGKWGKLQKSRRRRRLYDKTK